MYNYGNIKQYKWYLFYLYEYIDIKYEIIYNNLKFNVKKFKDEESSPLRFLTASKNRVKVLQENNW